MCSKVRRMRAVLAFSMAIIFTSIFLPTSAKAAASNLYTEGTTSLKLVALTFDDGDPLDMTQPLLDLLAANNVKATFFINGKYAYPDSVLAISEAGHEIGNHTYTHSDLTTLSYYEIQSELDGTNNAIKSITGKSTRPLFRPPYGLYDDNVLKAAGDDGYTMTVNWSIDSDDYDNIPADEIYHNVVDNIAPGSIVLMHTGDNNSIYALQDIIDTLKSEGYVFVTASDIINPPSPDMLAGADRYETAVEISKASYSSADTAILATGLNFPDALAAGPLAVQEGAPILLTEASSIPQATLDELERLNVKKVIIMGGENVVAASEAATLTGLGFQVQRVSGTDRYITAVEAAKLVRAQSGITNKAVLATGLDFPDALCIGSYASKAGIPILLTEAGALTASTKAAIKDFGITQVVIAGGPNVVSQNVANELADMGVAVTRSYGDTRYGTATEIASKFFPYSTSAIVATGSNFPDALAAVPLAAKRNAPILLADKDSVPAEVNDYIPNSEITDITVVGNQAAIGQLVKVQLMYLLK